jgi:hypothetical protein
MSALEGEIEQTLGDATPADVEMTGGGVEVIDLDTGVTAPSAENANVENGLPFQEEEEEEVVPTRVTFVDHLKSPVVELLIGDGDNQTLLTAHQALLVQCPFFEDACNQFSESVPVYVIRNWSWQAYITNFLCRGDRSFCRTRILTQWDAS